MMFLLWLSCSFANICTVSFVVNACHPNFLLVTFLQTSSFLWNPSKHSSPPGLHTVVHKVVFNAVFLSLKFPLCFIKILYEFISLRNKTIKILHHTSVYNNFVTKEHSYKHGFILFFFPTTAWIVWYIEELFKIY